MQKLKDKSIDNLLSFFKNNFYIFKNKLFPNIAPQNTTPLDSNTQSYVPMSNISTCNISNPACNINIKHTNNIEVHNIEVHETKINSDTITITTTMTTVTTIHNKTSPLKQPPEVIVKNTTHDNLETIPFINYSKYNDHIISSLIGTIIDTIQYEDFMINKHSNNTYLQKCIDFYNNQLDYQHLHKILDPVVYTEFEEIVTNILNPNPEYLYNLYQLKTYTDDLVNMYTRYGVFQTNNFIIKIDDASDIFTSELELMHKLGSGIILPHNIVLPYYVFIVKKNKNKNKNKQHNMHFSIQPRIKNVLPLHKWLRLSTSRHHNIEYYIKICITISKSILFMHSHELVHGDIKPDNILIETYTNTPYIIDFGLSGIHEFSQGTGGTRPFCCPETTNISTTHDDVYTWSKNSKQYDLWSIAFIFASIIIFKNSYNYYSDYPHSYFNKDKYINPTYLLRIPIHFKEPFMLVLCKKSDINLSNFIRLLEESLVASETFTSSV